MLLKIKRQACLDKYPKFPIRKYDSEKDEEECFYPEVFKSYVLTLDSKTLKGHTKSLATELTSLTTQLGFKSLIFLGDNQNHWLTKLSLGRTDYQLLIDALRYLIGNKVGKAFNGALKVDNRELPIFIKHLFCLVRCDASLPYIHFMDEGQNIIGRICQYGNVHLCTLNQIIDKIFMESLAKSRFINIDNKECISPFSKTSQLKIRQTTA